MCPVAGAVKGVAQFGRLVAGRAGREHPLAITRQLVEPVVAHRHAEILRSDVFELMRFVDDRAAAFRNHFAVRALPYRSVGAEQVMIHHDEVRLLGARAHPRHEAVGISRAFRPNAILRSRGDFIPERQVFGQVHDLGAIAGVGPFRPFLDDRHEDL